MWLVTTYQLVAQEAVVNCEVPGSIEWLSQRASPLDSAMVAFDGNVAKVCYSRPSARGRTVFGELVPYGKAWRTGANEPTILYLPVPAEVAGVRLEAGRYLLFTVPQPEEWVIVFYTSDADDLLEMFSTMQEVGLGVAVAESLPTHIETFTMRGVSDTAEPELLLEWEHVRVRIPFRAIRRLERDVVIRVAA